MRCEFVCLRDRGRVLKRGELDAPKPGRLQVGDFGLDAKGRPQRWMRVAHLWTDDPTRTVQCQARRPLFEPRIVSLDNGVLLLEGVEMHSDGADQPLQEHVQVWQIKLLSAL